MGRLTGLASLVSAAAFVASCSATASLAPSSPASPSTAPSSAASTHGPSPSPSPVPAPSLTPTAVDPELVLFADAVGDVVAGRIHGLRVYRDGTVLRGIGPGAITRLTPAAVDSLLAEVLGDPALGVGDIAPDPAHQAGFTSFIVMVRDSDALVRRGVTNASPPERRAEADRVIALVERLLALDTWLPPSSWVVPPQASEPWVPARYQLKVTDWGYPSQAPLQADVADVDWPLPGTPTDLGEPIDADDGYAPGDPNGPKATRCGVLGLEGALAVQAALNAGLGSPEIRITEQEWSVADLAWAERDSHLAISLHVLLPDDPQDCSVDTGWP